MRLIKSLLLGGVLGLTSFATYNNSALGEGNASNISGKLSSEISEASRNSTTTTTRTATTTTTTTTTTRGASLEEAVELL